MGGGSLKVGLNRTWVTPLPPYALHRGPSASAAPERLTKGQVENWATRIGALAAPLVWGLRGLAIHLLPQAPGPSFGENITPRATFRERAGLRTASAFSMWFFFFPSPPPPTSSLSLSNLSLFMIAGITEEEIRSPAERKVLCKTNE